jgi:hypothetical protein
LIRRRGILWYVLLALLNGLLLVGIVNIWWGEGSAPGSGRARQGPEAPKAPALRDSQPLEAFQVIAARNLFSPDRSGPAGGAAGKGVAGLEGSRLMGVIIVGDQRAALIARAGGLAPGAPGAPGAPPQQVEVVRLGEQLGNDTVMEISSDTVTFQGKSGKRTLGFPE